MTHSRKEDGTASIEFVRQAEDTVSRRVGETMVLINLQTDRIYELNRTGARLWELVREACERSHLHEQLLREFDVDPGELADEIDQLLQVLTAARLVTVTTN